MENANITRELFQKGALFQAAYESFAIHAAVELNLFKFLVDGGTATRIAADIGVEEKSAELLLNCLITAGLAIKADGIYRVNPRYQAAFSNEYDETLAMLASCKEQCRLWFDAASEIRGRHQTADITHRFDASPAWTSQYLQRVEQKNRPHARALAERLQTVIRDARRALDLGGGHGLYATELLKVNADLEITIVDLASSIDYCRRTFQGDDNLAQVRLLVGDARELAMEDTFDIVIISDLLHYFVDDEKLEVIKRALRALRKGGLVVISKFRLVEPGAHPRFAAFFALQKHLENPNGGYLETDERSAELMRAAGAVNVEVLLLNEEKCLITGVKTNEP